MQPLQPRRSVQSSGAWLERTGTSLHERNTPVLLSFKAGVSLLQSQLTGGTPFAPPVRLIPSTQQQRFAYTKAQNASRLFIWALVISRKGVTA